MDGEASAGWGGGIGSERRHTQERGSSMDGVDRLWVHPTHTTVGSALRLIGERLGEAGERPTRGVIVVPHDERAAWWKLTRHYERGRPNRLLGPSAQRRLSLNRR